MADALPVKTTMEFAYGVAREMAPGIKRVVAPNASPWTFKGTNTYLLGTRELAVIDPGPDDAGHIEAILAAANGRPISHVIITHTHRDHIDGMPALLAKTSAKTVGFGRAARDGGGDGGAESFSAAFTPDIMLTDGADIRIDDMTLEALHTPGHAPDHLCFAVAGTGLVFSGDHVMSWNTSVVAPPEGHMGNYMRSLEKLMHRTDTLYLPGHGGRFEEPQRLVKAFMVHRRMREQAILECVRKGARTAPEIVAQVYQGLDPRLVNAAVLSVLAHVEHLAERGLVRFSEPLSPRSDLSIV
jgi:glyoxylase-like metal-dependent hydrolase (beta-lactamase superfamily II)